MRIKNLLGVLLLFLCTINFTACDKDESSSLVANTTWFAKITPAEITVPEEYREKGYWMLTFTENNFSLSVCNECKIVVQHRLKGSYHFINSNGIIGKDDSNGTQLELILYPEKDEIYSRNYALRNFIKQPNQQ